MTAFLARALTPEEALSLTSIRASLRVYKVPAGDVVFLFAVDAYNAIRSAKYYIRREVGPGYVVGNALRISRPTSGSVFFSKSHWQPVPSHDVASTIKLVTEWLLREAIRSASRGITAARTKLFKFKTKDGKVEFQWVPVTELEEEEGEGYIPERFGPAVICLNSIETNESGQGQGTRLMELFLAHPEVKKAALVYLDPVPGYGNNHRSKESDATQMLNLARFYSRFGFRSAPGCARMWRVQKGKIQTKDLPT